jgi:hypothetical protein
MFDESQAKLKEKQAVVNTATVKITGKQLFLQNLAKELEDEGRIKYHIDICWIENLFFSFCCLFFY